jgi:hypothetical protein
MKKRLYSFLVLLLAVGAWSKEKNETIFTTYWPDAGSPTLKLDFGKFVQTAENAASLQARILKWMGRTPG